MYAILYNFSATIGGCILVVGACVVHSIVRISNAETEGRKDKPFAVQVRSLGCFLNGCGVLMHRMDYVCIILKDLHLRSINYIQMYGQTNSCISTSHSLLQTYLFLALALCMEITFHNYLSRNPTHV